VGLYTFVTAHVVDAKKYGYTPLHWFMLARDDKVIADDGAKVTFTKSGEQIDAHTGQPVPDAVCFAYLEGSSRYVLNYSREHTLVSQKLLDFAKGLRKVVAEIIRYPGGYLRFSGPVSRDCYRGGRGHRA
jgi:hypothetical protein